MAVKSIFRASLGTKFLVTMGLVIAIASGSVFYWMAKRQEAQIIAQVNQEAKILFDQIVLTRTWVSMQSGGGVLSEVNGNVQPNQYLMQVDGLKVNVTSEDGTQYTLRNHALVTKELSELAQKQNLYTFRLTSLNPVDPGNSPTGWERASLENFAKGEKKAETLIDQVDGKDVYRYMEPLYVRESCLNCHTGQGYQVGEVMGGISVTIPMDEARAAIQTNNRQLLLAYLGITILVLVILVILINRQISRPLRTLQASAQSISQGDLNQQVPVHSKDELGSLAESFNKMTADLKHLYTGLEEEVAAKTLSLETRAARLQMAAEIGRTVSSFLDPDQLLDQAAELIQNRFDYSHVGIFLMDGSQKHAILRAVKGQAGEAMKSGLHRIETGSSTTVGWVASNRKPRLIQGRGDARFRDPLLPETRSELAIPLIVQNRLLGILDIHSTLEEAFSEEDITILGILADQIGIAVENARLFQESQLTLSEMEKIQASYTQEAWETLKQAAPVLGYQYDPTGVKPIQVESSNNSGGDQESSGSPKPVSIPLQVRGKVIGTLDVWPEEEEISPEKLSLLQAVGERLSQSMESVRLYEETVHRAEHEQVVSDITVKLRETLDIDTILQTAAREFRKALALDEVEVRLGNGTDHGNQE